MDEDAIAIFDLAQSVQYPTDDAIISALIDRFSECYNGFD